MAICGLVNGWCRPLWLLRSMFVWARFQKTDPASKLESRSSPWVTQITFYNMRSRRKCAIVIGVLFTPAIDHWKIAIFGDRSSSIFFEENELKWLCDCVSRQSFQAPKWPSITLALDALSPWLPSLVSLRIAPSKIWRKWFKTKIVAGEIRWVSEV